MLEYNQYLVLFIYVIHVAVTDSGLLHLHKRSESWCTICGKNYNILIGLSEQNLILQYTTVEKIKKEPTRNDKVMNGEKFYFAF